MRERATELGWVAGPYCEQGKVLCVQVPASLEKIAERGEWRAVRSEPLPLTPQYPDNYPIKRLLNNFYASFSSLNENN